MEKDIPKYSIITPMFNSFNLMGPYFRSFLDQTYKNFEIIIIDDCSIDDSFKKAIEYSKNSPLNIKVFKTDNNAGPGNARNVGTHWAKGEWITYVDNDDWVDSKLLESIEKIITQYKVNCVVYDYALTNGKVIKKEKSMYHGKEGIISVADGVKYIRNHSVGKFYKKECIENIKYPKI